MNTIQDMVQKAQNIKTYADSEYCSERELCTMSEQFYITYGRSWVEVLF